MADDVDIEDIKQQLIEKIQHNDFQVSEPEEEGVEEKLKCAGEELERLETEAMRKRYDIQNLMYFEQVLDIVVENFKANLPLIWKHGVSYKKIPMPKPNTPAVVIGASPNLTDEDIIILKEFKGIVFCCNKSLKRCLNLGLVPDWLVLSHQTMEVYPHIDGDVVDRYKDRISVYTNTSIHPEVAKKLVQFKGIYWGNDIIDPRYYHNITNMMVRLSGIDEVASHGNVGTQMVLVANHLRCDPIGIIGIEFSVKPNPQWTQNHANTYRYFYIPERDEYIAIGSGFMVYADVLDKIMQENRADKRYKTNFINLTPTGFLRLNGTPYMNVEKFVRKYKRRKIIKW